MENKYYTPEINEFYVGFEYEELEEVENNNQTWNKYQVEKSDYLGNYNNSLALNEIRVKILDKEDIESLGFEEVESGIYMKDKTKFVKYVLDTRSSRFSIRNSIYNECWFYGTIKNKSELIRILKQLHID